MTTATLVREIKPVMTIEGTTVTAIEKGLTVELNHKIKGVRIGVVENGEQPTVIVLKTEQGFRSYKRAEIDMISFIL